MQLSGKSPLIFFDELPVAFDAHKNPVTKHVRGARFVAAGRGNQRHTNVLVPVGHECEEFMKDIVVRKECRSALLFRGLNVCQIFLLALRVH